MNLSQIKLFFRQKIKVVLGGPTDRTRGVGVLAALDTLAEQTLAGPNNSPQPVKVVDFYDTSHPGFDPAIHSALTTLDPEFLCLKTRCFVVNPGPGQVSEYSLEYTTFNPPVTFRVWRDGRFSQSGQQSDAQWYPVDAPEATVPTWAQLQSEPPTADYSFEIEELVRHAVTGTNELFFAALSAGVLAAPTLEGGDANWRRVAREAVPIPQASYYAAVTVAQAQALELDDAVRLPPFVYTILNANTGNNAPGALVIRGLPANPAIGVNSRFAPNGLWLDPADSTWKEMSYDLSSDKVSPLDGGDLSGYLALAGNGLDNPFTGPFVRQDAGGTYHLSQTAGDAILHTVYNPTTGIVALMSLLSPQFGLRLGNGYPLTLASPNQQKIIPFALSNNGVFTQGGVEYPQIIFGNAPQFISRRADGTVANTATNVTESVNLAGIGGSTYLKRPTVTTYFFMENAVIDCRGYTLDFEGNDFNAYNNAQIINVGLLLQCRIFCRPSQNAVITIKAAGPGSVFNGYIFFFDTSATVVFDGPIDVTSFGYGLGSGTYCSSENGKIILRNGARLLRPAHPTTTVITEPARIDVFEVPLEIRQAVVDGFAAQDTAGNTSPYLQTTQPAGSIVWTSFDDPQTNYRYDYRPVSFADGTYAVWSSYKIGR